MATLRLFAQAREAAGCATVDLEAATVGEVLGAARARFGEEFAAMLPTCQIWLNGHPTADDAPAGSGDEVAVLPPVSGG